MIPVTSEQVWKVINEDPEFLKISEAMREATRPFVEALPTMMSEMLNQHLTLNTLLQAKLIFLRYCHSNGYAEASVAAMQGDEFLMISREEMIEFISSIFSELIEIIEEQAGNITELLTQSNLTEAQVMLDPKVGLKDDVAKLYKTGELTIGKLLTLQPMIIVNNKPK